MRVFSINCQIQFNPQWVCFWNGRSKFVRKWDKSKDRGRLCDLGSFMCHLHNEKDDSISAWNEYSALSLLNHSSHNHKHAFELEVLLFYWHLHDTFGSHIIKIQTWVISILLHHSKMRENIWSKLKTWNCTKELIFQSHKIKNKPSHIHLS